MRFRRTTVITAGLFAFLAGLGFTRTGWLISHELLISLSILSLVTILRLRWLAFVSIILFGFGLGMFRGQNFLATVKPLYELNDLKKTATVVADSDAVYNERGQLEFDAKNLTVDGKQLPGRLTISGYGEPAIFKGDTVQITGRFYDTRGSKQLGMSFAELKLVNRQDFWVDSLRREFGAGLQSTVPEPQASFGLGLLIGQRTTLPKNVNDQLSAVGLTHIIAVSGYNLTIIMRGVRRLLAKRSKYQITALSVALMVTFLLMTGMSASIVRAAIVSGLSLAAWYYGRTIKPVMLLALTAAITAVFNPFYLWSDVGWYLSFLAFFGVLVIAPLLNKRIYKTAEPRAMPALVTESICAILMTLPIIMFIFGKVSLVALPANLIVVPLVPIAMLLSVVAGLGGMFLGASGGLVAWPATMVMTTMLDIANLFSRIPHALKEQTLSLNGLLGLYGCILFITVVLWHRTLKNDRITEMNMETKL